MRKRALIFYSFFICYLVLGTGLVSDDLVAAALRIKSLFIETPLMYLTHYIWYPFFSFDNPLLPSLFKVMYMCLCFYAVSRFFTLYLDQAGALLAAFLFIFFPSHDATVYMFMSEYLTISFAAYLFAYYLAERGRMFAAFVLAVAASFISYGATPLAIALALLFFMRKKKKQAAIMLVPNIVYILYFVPINMVMRLGSPRIIESFNIAAFIKQFVLQVLTLTDACFGLSLWLKIYYAFFELTLVSLAIGVIFFLWFVRRRGAKESAYEPKLIIVFLVMLFFSSAQFAATGRYPQIAFNLGDRVSIYGSLLVAYLIAASPKRLIRITLAAVMILAACGISDHWKKWDKEQVFQIMRLKDCPGLLNYSGGEPVYFSGNQYSKYGPFAHIEFYSEDWVPYAACKLALGRIMPVKSLNKRHRYESGYLLDEKYGLKTRTGGSINIYDSAKGSFLVVPDAQINAYIDSLPVERRHWLQFVNVGWLKGLVTRLMPRLKYAL